MGFSEDFNITEEGIEYNITQMHDLSNHYIFMKKVHGNDNADYSSK